MQPIQGIRNEEEYLQQRSSKFQYLDFNDYKLRKLKVSSIAQATYSDLELQLCLSQRKYCLTAIDLKKKKGKIPIDFSSQD